MCEIPPSPPAPVSQNTPCFRQRLWHQEGSVWHLRHNIASGWEPREKPGQARWERGLEMELILVAEEAARRESTLMQCQRLRGEVAG